MPGKGAPVARSAARRRLLRAGLVALAAGWLFLVLALTAGAGRAQAQPFVLGNLSIPVSTTGTPIPTGPAATPTNTPALATATPTTQATATPVPAAPTPTDTPAAQPTRAVFSEPTLGTTSGSGPAGFSPENLASYGLVISTVLGCVLGVIGLIALAFTGLTLSSDGWGPLIKAVLLGNRRGRRRFNSRPRNTRPGRQAPSMHPYDDWR